MKKERMSPPSSGTFCVLQGSWNVLSRRMGLGNHRGDMAPLLLAPHHAQVHHLQVASKARFTDS